MNRIHIFKAGKHTSANGATLEFSEDDLKKAVEAYDPALHEAPIVVGHPKDNGPAYGWVGALEYSDAGMYAEPRQVQEDFQEQVQEGRYKKVSASFYMPDAPNNPAPGSLYLRHVGFLGAAPPAIKGLEPIQFSDTEEGVVEFNEIANSTMTGVMKRMREWLIDKFSRDEADSVIPAGAIEDMEFAQEIEREERRAQAEASNPEPGFSEHQTPTEDDPMNLQEQLEQAQNRIQELEGKTTEFSERENQLAERERQIDKQDLQTKIKAAADEGRVMPGDVEPLAEFAAQLAADDDNAVEFSEGDKKAPREFFMEWLARQPKRVDFGEHSNDGDAPAEDEGPAATARRITDYRERMNQNGHSITYDQALSAVKAGTDRAE